MHLFLIKDEYLTNAQVELDIIIGKLELLGVRITSKTGNWWKFLSWLNSAFNNKNFSNESVITVYKTIGVPPDWNNWPAPVRLRILTHELVRANQLKRWTTPGFFLLYFLFPFPIGLAYFRYRFNREAYVAEFAIAVKYKILRRDLLIDHAVKQLVSINCGWPWPFPKSIRAWFEGNVPNE